MTFIYPYETVNRDNTVFKTVFQILVKIQYGRRLLDNVIGHWVWQGRG